MNSVSLFPEALVEAVRHARLVPFVGSYVPRLALTKQGQPLLPDWRSLLRGAADELRSNGKDSERRLLDLLLEPRRPDYYQAILAARAALGNIHWQRFLHQQFNPEYDRMDASSIHAVRAIWNLGCKLVVTTTPDRILSWACPWPNDLGRWVHVPPDYAADMSFCSSGNPSNPVIWHTQGFVDDPANLIFTPRGRILHPEDSSSSRRYRAALGVMHNLLLSRTILFVGFGESDAYFLNILRQVYDLFHQCGGPHYALIPEKDMILLQARIGDLPLTLIPYKQQCEEHLLALAQKAEQSSIANISLQETLPGEDTTQVPTVGLEVMENRGSRTDVQLPARYQVREKIGQGGMGAVYLAYDRQLDREVAAKVILPSLMSPEADQRFGQEARAIAKLDHPSIVPVYDYGRYNETVYLTMPLIRGKLLRKLMREKTANLAQKLEICAQLADALDYSHSQGVYHCDIKPENIMVREEGDVCHVRVMDFGLAQLATRKRVTKKDDVAGTPLYLSPEQCTSDQVDGRADLYALGTIIYEFLAGETPFKGPFHSLLYKIVNERPPLLLSRGVDIDEELESLVLGCLAKNPENRPQRGRDLGVALRSYLDRRNGRGNSGHYLAMQPQGASATPLVGREDEVSELFLRLDASLAGVCQLAVIGGESGMGKTRLLQEVEQMARQNSEPFQVWWGRFPEHDGTLPYQVLSELVVGFFAGRDEETPLPDIKDLAPDLIRLMPALAEIGPIREAAGRLPKGKSKVRGHRFAFDLMARTIRRLSGDRPTVLLLENLGGAGSSLEGLQYLVQRLGATPTVIVGTYRSGLANNHPINKFLRTYQGDPRFLSLELQPLDENRHRRLLNSLLSAEVGDELVDKIFETSEGNPYFTQELVRSLRESGGLVFAHGAWEFSDDAAQHNDALPRTIQGAVEERIRHLDESVRDILTTAAVLGRTFSFADLEALETNPRSLDDALDLLIYEGILAEDTSFRSNSYSFQSKVVRDVLYQRFSRRRRRELHLRYAHHLEQSYAGKLERVYSELVHHFAEGDDPEKTVSYAIKQAQRALDAYAPEDAIQSIELALSFVRDEGYEGGAIMEGRLCLLLSQAQLGMGHLELALSEVTESVRAFKKGNDAHGASEATLLAAETAWRLHKVETTRRWVENGIALARTVEGPSILYALLSLAAKVANLSRNYNKAREYLEEAEQIAPTNKLESATSPIPYGGRLVTAVQRPLTSLQPGRIQIYEELEFSANVFETLLTMDNDGKVAPLLAERWEHHNFIRFRFYLNVDATFSDGSALTAGDVKTALETAATSVVGRTSSALLAIEGFSAFASGDAGEITGIQAELAHCVSIQLKEALPIFPSLMTDHANTAIFKFCDSGSRALIGSGPFVICKQEAGLLELARNRTYWRKTLAYLETIECRVVTDSDGMINGLRTGALDLGRDLTSEQVEAMLRIPHFQRGLVECTRKSVGFLLFNRGSKSLASVEVRTALMGMLRVRELVWHSLGRSARPATGLIPPGVLGHDPARRSPLRIPGGEMQILKDHGLEAPVVLTAMVHPLVGERYGSLVFRIFREWMTLGIEVKKLPFSSDIFNGSSPLSDQVDLVITRYRGLYDDPDAFTHQLFHSSGTFGAWCESPERNTQLQEARLCENADERRQLYRKFESGLLDDGLVLPLFYDIDCRIACTRLKGVVLSPNPPFVNYLEMGKNPDRVPVVPAGVVRIPLTGKLQHLDPAHMPSYDYAEVVPNIFETLTRVGEGAHVESCLATFYTEDGGRRYHFQLRDNIYFHDGRGLTTRDVRYTFERVLRESKFHANLLQTIQGAEAFRANQTREIAGLRLISDHLFTIDLEKPLSFFPGVLSHPALGILPDGAALPGELLQAYIGTGPFRLDRFVPSGKVLLAANLQYWKKGLPKSGHLEFHLGMGPGAVAKAFRAGSLSMASGVYPEEAESLRSLSGFRQEMSESPGLSTYFLVFNTHDGPLASRDTRRALIAALNVGRAVKETMGGLCLEAGGFIPPGLAGREAPVRLSDSEHTQTLPPGFTIHAAIHPFFYRQFVHFWEKINADMARLGMTVKPIHREMIASVDALPKPLDMVAYRWFADYPDADTFMKLLHRKTGLFGQLAGTERIDMLIEKGRIETDEDLRAEIYAEVEDIIAREALMLPLFHETNYRLARPELHGLSTRIGFPLVTYEKLHIEGDKD